MRRVGKALHRCHCGKWRLPLAAMTVLFICPAYVSRVMAQEPDTFVNPTDTIEIEYRKPAGPEGKIEHPWQIYFDFGTNILSGGDNLVLDKIELNGGVGDFAKSLFGFSIRGGYRFNEWLSGFVGTSFSPAASYKPSHVSESVGPHFGICNDPLLGPQPCLINNEYNLTTTSQYSDYFAGARIRLTRLGGLFDLAADMNGAAFWGYIDAGISYSRLDFKYGGDFNGREVFGGLGLLFGAGVELTASERLSFYVGFKAAGIGVDVVGLNMGIGTKVGF